MARGGNGPLRDPRSWGLLFMAGVCASRAAAYAPGSSPEKLPVGLREVALVVPVWVYGIMWGASAVGLAMVAFLQWPPKRWQALLVAPAMLWGGFYVTTWLLDHNAGNLAAAFLFFCLAGVTACLILIPPRNLR